MPRQPRGVRPMRWLFGFPLVHREAKGSRMRFKRARKANYWVTRTIYSNSSLSSIGRAVATYARQVSGRNPNPVISFLTRGVRTVYRRQRHRTSPGYTVNGVVPPVSLLTCLGSVTPFAYVCPCIFNLQQAVSIILASFWKLLMYSKISRRQLPLSS